MTAEALGLLLWALAACESGWDAGKDSQVCNGAGMLQITPIMVEDCNRIMKHNSFTLDDRYDIIQSYEMAGVFFEEYCEGMSAFDMARCWQGGPKGHLKPFTAEQAQRVVNLMEDAGRKRGIQL